MTEDQTPLLFAPQSPPTGHPDSLTVSCSIASSWLLGLSPSDWFSVEWRLHLGDS